MAGLFIYLFYRTEKTVVNELMIQMITAEGYFALRDTINDFVPLPGLVIYSVPGGLWVFCATLTSMPFYLHVSILRIRGVYFPLIISLGLEAFQYVGITHGRFDIIDVIVSVMFWCLARYFFETPAVRKNIFTSMSYTKALCLASYGIVYLSHVVR